MFAQKKATTVIVSILFSGLCLMLMLQHNEQSGANRLLAAPLPRAAAPPRPRPHPSDQPAPQEDQQHQSNDGPTTWISMGLCFSHNTELFGKAKYPYATVTPLSVMLWKYHMPHVQVLLQIVYDAPYAITDIMRDYEATLVQSGAAKVLWVKSNGTDCVLLSQLIRMLAFRLEDTVRDDDVVVTMDVNAFLMSPRALDPIAENPGVRAWVFQYQNTAHGEKDKGDSFNQNLMSMRAKDWRDVLDFRPTDSVAEWLEAKVDELGLDRELTWYYDQWITTLSLLRHRVCTVPGYSGLWRNKGLTYDPYLDDTVTCWHGRGYEDCNKDIHIVYQGCKWWHFYPDQTFDEHVEKFKELTNHTIGLEFHSPFDD